MPVTLYGTVRDRQYRQTNLPQDNYWQNRLGLILTKTRFYLPSSGSAPVSPAFDAAWSETGVADRISMSTSKLASSMTLKTVTTLITAETSLWRQYVSAPLQAQTLSSAIKLYARSIMGIGLGVTSRLVVKVVSNDGGTVRGILLSIADYSTGTTFATTLTNKAFADGDPPSSVNALDGDRLVIEIGFNHGAAIGDVSASFGDNSGTDLAEDESTTAANNPWFDMYQAILFQSSPFLTYDPQSWPRGPKHVARQRFQQQLAGAAAEDVGASPMFYLTGQDRIYGGSGQVPDYDWQNSLPRALLNYRRLRDDFQHASDIKLIGQDRVYGGPGQVPDYDWQSSLPPRQEPVRALRYLAGRTLTDVAPSDTFYIGFDRIYAGPGQVNIQDFPNPPRGYLRAPDLRLFFDSLLPVILAGQDSIYAGPGQVPEYDWQNVLPRILLNYRRPSPDWLHASDVQLIGQDVFPRQNLDLNLSLPPRGYRRLIPDFLHNSDIQLIGQDRVYVGPGQVPDYDWYMPVQLRTIRRPMPDQQVVPQTLGAIVGPTPFYGSVTDVPRGYRRQLADFLHDSDIQLIGQDAFFGAPGQVQALDLWLPPRGYKRPSPDFILPSDIALAIASLPPFLGSATELAPRGYTRPPTFWMRASDVQLIGLDALPKSNLDSTLQMPSRGYKRPSPDWVRASDVQLIGQDAFPQYNVESNLVLPSRGYRRPSPDWLHSSDIILIGQDVLPRANVEGNLALPSRGYRRPPPDLLHASDIILIGADQLPQRNHQDVVDLPPFYSLKRRIAEPSTPLGTPDILTTLAPPPTQAPLTINDAAYTLPARGYRRLSTSDLSIARGLFPVYIVVLGANKQLEAYLFVPDSTLGANIWLPDSSFSVESEDGPNVILPGTSD